MNSVTPRLFVAATEQNDGKTTTALGLFSALRKRFGRIGFIKPVGQRFIEVEGKRIDEDTFLIDETFRVDTPLEDMSPIAVEPDFTRRYIEHANSDFLSNTDIYSQSNRNSNDGRHGDCHRGTFSDAYAEPGNYDEFPAVGTGEVDRQL